MTSFINRLLHKKSALKKASSQLDHEPQQSSTIISTTRKASSRNGTIATPSAESTHLEVPQLIVGVAQSVGIQRDNNEDSLFTLTTNLISDQKTINFGLYIIADGMGGHNYGELASSLAVGKLASHVIDNLYLPLMSSGSKLEYSIQEVLQAGVLQAHQTIKKEAVGGGTTLTSALILGDQMTVIHVGDSRAYSIDPAGYMQLLTHDHTLVKRLEEIGQISPDQVSSHPQRNLLYRALGQGESFEPDFTSLQICKGYQLLLCSDGLWSVVPENELLAILHSSPEPQLVCQALVQAANAAGGPDNISVIIVRIPQ